MIAILLITDALFLSLFLYHLYSSFTHGHSESPCAIPIARSGIPWLGDGFRFMFRRSKLFKEYRSMYGPVYRFKALGRSIVVVSSPVTINDALHKPTTGLAPFTEGNIRFITGLTDDLPEVARLMRRFGFPGMRNQLSGRKLAEITTPLNHHLWNSLNSLIVTSRVQTISLAQLVIPSLYQAAVSAIFGEAFIAETPLDFAEMDSGTFFVTNYMPFLAKKALKARKRLLSVVRAYVGDVWDKSDCSIIGASSLVSELIQRLRDDGLSIDGTARVLTFVIWISQSSILQTTIAVLGYIIADPELYRSLAISMRKTVVEKFADLPSFCASESDSLNGPEFDILDSIVQETLRCDMTSPIFRRVLQDTFIRGENNAVYHLRKGEILFVDVRGMHHDEAFYPCPDTFIPHRFSGKLEQHQFGIMDRFRPFGGGSALCKGRALTRHVIKMFLLQMFLLYDIKPPSIIDTRSKNHDHSLVIAAFSKSPEIRLQRNPLWS